MFANFKCHLEFTLNGTAHIVLDEDYSSGRLHRKADHVLCGTHKWNWSREGSSTEPTCKRCKELLERHSPVPPKPSITQLALMQRIERTPNFHAHWGHAATKKALFDSGYIELYRNHDGLDCIYVTASGKTWLPPLPAHARLLSPEKDPVLKWVNKVNKLALEIDAEADSMHPSKRKDALASDLEKFKRLAAFGPRAKPAPTVPPHIIYTIGYEGRSPTWLLSVLVELDAAVLDVRFSPKSRNPLWNKSFLLDLLGNRYRHIGEWGNRNYKGGPIDLVDYEAGRRRMLQVLQEKTTLFIMCVCKDPARCHRTAIADRLRADGFTVSEYVPPAPPRFQPMLF